MIRADEEKKPPEEVYSVPSSPPKTKKSEEDMFRMYSEDIVSCQICDQKFYSSFDLSQLVYADACLHLFCKKCLARHIDQELVNQGGCLQCPIASCKENIPETQVKVALIQFRS